MIDEQNYEAYLLQYHDGALDEQGVKEVEAFLLQHPLIAWEDKQYYSGTPIVAPLVSTYLYKGFLKHPHTHYHRGWYWAAAACVAGLLVTVWLWNIPEGTHTQPVVAQQRTVATEVAAPTTGRVPQQALLAATSPTDTRADAQVRIQQSSHEEQRVQESEVGQVTEEAVADVTPPTPTAPMLCESDQLVVYGCPTVNSSSLVQYSEQQPVCNSFACRLHLTGRRLGML